MRRRVTPEELGFFYHEIGAAIWHVQYLEDVLVTYLTMVVIDSIRRGGKEVGKAEGDRLLAQNRRLTFGPLVRECAKRSILRDDWVRTFEEFKEERHWLVHRSMVENGDDLYLDRTREEVFARVSRIKDHATGLRKIVAPDLERWVKKHGGDPAWADRVAREQLRRLEGT